MNRSASSESQRDIYDSRNLATPRGAWEEIFACQLIYRRDLLLETLKTLSITPPSGESVWVYVGGGEGTQCMVLSAIGGTHLSLDISPTQLLLGRWLMTRVADRYIPGLRSDRVFFACADALKPLPVHRLQADVAYGLGVMNHLPPQAWADHLRELRGILKPGGTIFHVLPNLDCEVYSRPIFTRQFADSGSMQYWTQFVSEDNAVAAFREAGLSDIRTAKLWRYDHDAGLRYLRIPEVVCRRIVQRFGSRISFRIVPALQRWARRSAEAGRWTGRPWTLRQPRHLAVAGTCR